jgi:hypothetical protein
MFHTLSVCVYFRERKVTCRPKYISIVETARLLCAKFVFLFLEGEIRTIILDSRLKLKCDGTE